jgi:hypothetical protein
MVEQNANLLLGTTGHEKGAQKHTNSVTVFSFKIPLQQTLAV